MESEAVWQCGRAECKVCGGSPAVRDWLWSEVELGFRVSVGKVGGSVLCRSHLPQLPDPRSRGNYLPVRWRWRGVAEEVRVEMGGEGGSEVTLLPVIFPLSYP